jgi:hypothetical protein
MPGPIHRQIPVGDSSVEAPGANSKLIDDLVSPSSGTLEYDTAGNWLCITKAAVDCCAKQISDSVHQEFPARIPPVGTALLGAEIVENGRLPGSGCKLEEFPCKPAPPPEVVPYTLPLGSTNTGFGSSPELTLCAI